MSIKKRIVCMKPNIHDLGYEPTDLHVTVSELMVAISGARPTIAVGESEELEQSWCQRVVDGRLPRFMADARADPVASALLDQLPFPIGTHTSTPIVLKNSEVYGTLCSFSFGPHDNPNPDDLKTLEMTAKLAALRLEGRNVMPAPRDVPDWDLKPK